MYISTAFSSSGMGVDAKAFHFRIREHGVFWAAGRRCDTPFRWSAGVRVLGQRRGRSWRRNRTRRLPFRLRCGRCLHAHARPDRRCWRQAEASKLATPRDPAPHGPGAEPRPGAYGLDEMAARSVQGAVGPRESAFDFHGVADIDTGAIRNLRQENSGRYIRGPILRRVAPGCRRRLRFASSLIARIAKSAEASAP